MKVILGAGGTSQTGWTPLEFDDLDMRSRGSWAAHFAPGTIDAVLTEHVLEHLDTGEAIAAARNIFEFLKPGGYWRIAVPDAYNPDPKYHEWSSPTGIYQTVWQPFFQDQSTHPAHKQFFSIDSLSSLLESFGFSVHPLEWFDYAGKFHRNQWSQSDGTIYRALGTEHSAFTSRLLLFDNISLIVDAIKP